MRRRAPCKANTRKKKPLSVPSGVSSGVRAATAPRLAVRIFPGGKRCSSSSSRSRYFFAFAFALGFAAFVFGAAFFTGFFAAFFFGAAFFTGFFAAFFAGFFAAFFVAKTLTSLHTFRVDMNFFRPLTLLPLTPGSSPQTCSVRLSGIAYPALMMSLQTSMVSCP